jgi:hypothetical protein
MKTYISGPITGLPIEQARAAFSEAEFRLKSVGMEVVNPMNLPHNHDKSRESYMKECILALMDCDAIYMLKGYMDSRGAIIELNLAYDLNIKPLFSK